MCEEKRNRIKLWYTLDGLKESREFSADDSFKDLQVAFEDEKDFPKCFGFCDYKGEGLEEFFVLR